jgi:integrase
MASIQARHSRSCGLGDTFRAPEHEDGCTCQPTLYVFVRQGRKTDKHRVGRNMKHAVRLRTKLQGQEDESGYAAVKNIRFEEWGDRWLASLERKETTRLESYPSTIKWAKKAFGRKPVRQIQLGDVVHMNSLMREGKLSDSTRAKHLRVLKACLNSALAHGYAAVNPVSRLPKNEKPTAKKKEAAYFTNEELPRLFAALSDELDRVLYETALKTGMRQGELLALTWGDVELSEAAIQVRRTITKGHLSETKNRQSRTAHLPPEVVELLGAWWGECGGPAQDVLVFPGDVGYLSPYVALNRLRAAMKRAGVPLVGPTGEPRTFHSLRHTFAKLALENGCSITWLSRHLGHKTTSVTTDTYGHWEAKTAKAEAEKMAGVFGV